MAGCVKQFTKTYCKEIHFKSCAYCLLFNSSLALHSFFSVYFHAYSVYLLVDFSLFQLTEDIKGETHLLSDTTFFTLL